MEKKLNQYIVRVKDSNGTFGKRQYKVYAETKEEAIFDAKQMYKDDFCLKRDVYAYQIFQI